VNDKVEWTSYRPCPGGLCCPHWFLLSHTQTVPHMHQSACHATKTMGHDEVRDIMPQAWRLLIHQRKNSGIAARRDSRRTSESSDFDGFHPRHAKKLRSLEIYHHNTLRRQHASSSARIKKGQYTTFPPCGRTETWLLAADNTETDNRCQFTVSRQAHRGPTEWIAQSHGYTARLRCKLHAPAHAKLQANY
jgi:hypothetical protein